MQAQTWRWRGSRGRHTVTGRAQPSPFWATSLFVGARPPWRHGQHQGPEHEDPASPRLVHGFGPRLSGSCREQGSQRVDQGRSLRGASSLHPALGCPRGTTVLPAQEGDVLRPGLWGHSTTTSLGGGPASPTEVSGAPGRPPGAQGRRPTAPQASQGRHLWGQPVVAGRWAGAGPERQPSPRGPVVRSDTSVGKPGPAWTVMNRQEGRRGGRRFCC